MMLLGVMGPAAIGTAGAAPLAAGDITTYRIVVVTGAMKDAGTDADVYITLFGTEGNSGERQLDNSGNDFERGHTDVYSITMEDIGDLEKIRIRHNNKHDKPGWFLDRVTVQNERTGTAWVFPCSRWLATDEDDGQIDRLLGPR
jgi:hypothetical protein